MPMRQWVGKEAEVSGIEEGSCSSSGTKKHDLFYCYLNIFMYSFFLSAYMSVYHLYVWCHVRSSGFSVTDTCEFWESNSGFLT